MQCIAYPKWQGLGRANTHNRALARPHRTTLEGQKATKMHGIGPCHHKALVGQTPIATHCLCPTARPWLDQKPLKCMA